MAPKGTRDTLTGSYLAGSFARASRDNEAAATFYARALAEDPSNQRLRFYTLVAMTADGRIPEAVKLARDVVAAEPRNILANIILASSEMRFGDMQAAEQIAGAMVPGERSALLRYGIGAWARFGRGDIDGALRTLAPLSDSNELGVFHDYLASLLLDAAGRGSDAEAAFNRLQQRGPVNSVRLAETYGRLLERRGRIGDAKALYEGFLARNPDARVIQEGLARIVNASPPPAPMVATAADGLAELFYNATGLLRRDDPAELREIYLHLALYLRPNLAVASVQLGEILEQRQDWDRAIEIYARVDAASAYFDQARLRIAWCYNEMGKFDEAVKRLRALSAERADWSEPLVSLGDVLRSKDRFAEAAAAYGEGISRIAKPEERHWALFYARGTANERARNWSAAEADFLKALQLRPNQPLVLNYLGYSWLEQGVRLAEAMQMIENARRQRPNDGAIVDSLGWAHFRLGNFAAAVEHLERAAELKADDPVITDHLGDAYWRVGRQTEARYQWFRALSLNPEPDLKAQIEKKLEGGLEPLSRNASDGSRRQG